MKTRIMLSMAVLFAAALGARAEDPVLPANANRALIEKNLLNGLNSMSEGVCYDCALILGKIKSTDAVIPLMALLKDSESLKLKTAAAWALCNIGDARGTFAVKREAEFNASAKTQLVCAWYYEHMVKSGSFIFKENDETMLAESHDQYRKSVH